MIEEQKPPLRKALVTNGRVLAKKRIYTTKADTKHYT
jgi:hypothetical protein